MSADLSSNPAPDPDLTAELNPPDMEEPAPPPPPAGMRTALVELSKKLIDISKRNRLTNSKLHKPRSKVIDIYDERSDEIFKLLYVNRRKMRFIPSDAEDSTEDISAEDVFVPGWKPDSAAARHTDTYLQTQFTQEALHKKLISIYRDASSMEEEQGVSVLYLALGFVEWFESESSDIARYAPLVLLPVDLERDSARGRFSLILRDQDLEPNLSLKAMLKEDFSLDLPEFPQEEEWVPSDYFFTVNEIVKSRHRWQLRPNTMQLGFYSFAKFLMYRDLEVSGNATGSSLLSKVLVKGFETQSNGIVVTGNLDREFPEPQSLCHILDADASQTRIIEAARKGTDIVVQGPPGTGKSQTIANIIAAASKEGKTILFLAEKRAALDVVFARLKNCDLDPLCLELHSHKVSRKHVYDELRRTLKLGQPRNVAREQYERLRRVRDDLNATSDLLHSVDEQSGQTPFAVMGTLSKLLGSELPRPDFTVKEAANWTKLEFEERLSVVGSLADYTLEYGSEREHLWRGAGKKLDPIDRERLKDYLRKAQKQLSALEAALEAAAIAAGIKDAKQPSAVDFVIAQLTALEERPPGVKELLSKPANVEDPTATHSLFGLVAKCQQLKRDLLQRVDPSALDESWQKVRREIHNRGRSFFRFLSGDYRRAMARLKNACSGSCPKSFRARIDLLDELIEHKTAVEKVRRQHALGAAIVGIRWQNEETDVDRLLPAAQWIAAQAESLGSGFAVQQQVDGLPPGADLHALRTELKQTNRNWDSTWHRIAELISLNHAARFGTEDIGDVQFDVLFSCLHAWTANSETLDDWHRLIETAKLATGLGLDTIREQLASGTLNPRFARQSLEFVWAEVTWKRMCAEDPRLNRLDGADRSAKIEEFKRLDEKLKELASQEVMVNHYQDMPQGMEGQMGFIRGEVNKKRRQVPLRKLLTTAGEAIQKMKPVFLMSPLSVAQYLPMGKISFDLLLIDEASQVRPEDAVGAIMRASQLVVVGDQKQLPPTSFFDRQVSGDDEADDFEERADQQAAQVGDMESILSLCEARSMPDGMLEWHYRSSHPSLISVSNHEFYEDKLIFPPSPSDQGEKIGMSFTYVGGKYLRGTRRTNPDEVEAITKSVLEHARERPSYTLGVVAMSVAQRDAILDRMEFMRTRYPELEKFCNEGRQEPFFVKNLENVQGDERDVIYVSVGYGRDPNGFLSQSFGPLSQDGGERRLNVLFTRAKRQCRIFSSIRYGEIRVGAAKYEGPRVLRRFLKYAETGDLDEVAPTGGELESPFEESVARALDRNGYRWEAQVGSAGFRIDLAVVDPANEGRYILAVECDGARYHSASWARERDRLRQAVLESKGWRFHRIWSTDWFANREKETRKLVAAIEQAKAGGTAHPKRPAPSGSRVERAKYKEKTGYSARRYVEKRFRIANSAYFSIPEAPERSLERDITKIVNAEGPVHRSIVCKRLSDNWGNRQMGKRIKITLNAAIDRAIRKGKIRQNPSGKFLDRYHRQAPVVVRDRGHLDSYMRKPDVIPEAEIRVAAVEVVRLCVSISMAECAKAVSRMFGFKALHKALRARIESGIKQSVADGQLRLTDGELRLP